MPGRPNTSSQGMTSAEIRQSFLDFFAGHGHTIVPSAPLVPGGDETLLFTNAGMVQFKDVFLGAGQRPYTRAVDSQKCMRVAGKHNDLDDVGRDDIHHTFFEMLGNWSFGDYYKKEAISWAWELLTENWGLPKENLYATCFEDEQGQIPRDDEAADIWRAQPGMEPEHVLFFGRKDNFWEMAETGPCGPDSEIHLDRGPEYCDKQDVPGHQCGVNGSCQRFLELWNLVFIQYNRTGPNDLAPLPHKHVDTGMGFERLVSVLQGVKSDYRTDLFTPIMDRIQALAGHTQEEREALLTPYRVIADHSRAAAFLIADGVVPGNTGRNYVCRMIIRRASRFGSHAGFEEPFLAQIAEVVTDQYGDFYPELRKARQAIVDTLTDEEARFHRTVEGGVSHLMNLIDALGGSGQARLDGRQAFDLYATYGLPLEITRDIAREHGIDVDEPGFKAAMEAHRLVSSSDNGAEAAGGPDIELYSEILARLKGAGKLGDDGVEYDPYHGLESEGPILALVRDGAAVPASEAGQEVAVVLPSTHFYVEGGGQVSDTGTIVSVSEPRWEIDVTGMRRPVAGLVCHIGRVRTGQPKVGDLALAAVDENRRLNIMRNHTATHLLHAALQSVLGDHARQAGSLVAPDRLRFDFNHPRAMTAAEIDEVESIVNDAILENLPVAIDHKGREEAVEAGAMALFGENYGEIVRTVRVGQAPFSYELCGGTHVPQTGIIAPFLILNESSAAAGIRRIEAVTGTAAVGLVRERLASLKRVAAELDADAEAVEERLGALLEENHELKRQAHAAQSTLAGEAFEALAPLQIEGVPVIVGEIPDADAEVLRELTDRFRASHPSGVVVLASKHAGRPLLVAAVSKDLVARGLHAGELVKEIARPIGGSGGGKPTLAQAGGKDAGRIPEALGLVEGWVKTHLA